MATSVPVFSRSHPFAPPERREMSVGLSILEIVRATPNLPPRFLTDGMVLISDQPVPRERWAHIRPKFGADVQLCLVPEGSDVFRTVAMIAILAGSVLISGGALAPFGVALGLEAGTFAAGSISASAAGLGFSCGGSLQLNALENRG